MTSHTSPPSCRTPSSTLCQVFYGLETLSRSRITLTNSSKDLNIVCVAGASVWAAEWTYGSEKCVPSCQPSYPLTEWILSVSICGLDVTVLLLVLGRLDLACQSSFVLSQACQPDARVWFSDYWRGEASEGKSQTSPGNGEAGGGAKSPLKDYKYSLYFIFPNRVSVLGRLKFLILYVFNVSCLARGVWGSSCGVWCDMWQPPCG